MVALDAGLETGAERRGDPLGALLGLQAGHYINVYLYYIGHTFCVLDIAYMYIHVCI